MTTNVPQDVIDELEKISQDIASAGIHGFGNQISDAVSKLRDQRAGGEAVAVVRGVSEAKVSVKWLHGFPAIGEKLYRQPQPTLDFAAGMMKAADEFEAMIQDRENPYDNALYYVVQQLRAATPKESADALKEYVSGKCALDIKTIHHIALNPLDCDIAHRDEDSLTVKLVKNMAYLIRKDGK